MSLNFFEDARRLTLDLVKVPSVVGAEGQEAALAKRIYEFYSALPYFAEHPEQLMLRRTEADETERYNVLAVVRGTGGASDDAVILMGHLDTVGISDYGALQHLAYEPEALARELRGLGLGEAIDRDIDSGEYMFGRGALDMKSGLAAQMLVVKYLSENTHLISGTVVVMTAPDEEDSSHGAISGLSTLAEIKEKYGLNYLGAMNADYTTPYYEGDPHRYVYFGTIGKTLPSVYIRGREAHAGDPFAALDPNQLIAEVTALVNLNPELCDAALGEVTMPPVSLRQADFKTGYNVQTAVDAFAYYNVFSYSRNPQEVLELFGQQVRVALDAATAKLEQRYEAFCKLAGRDYSPLGWAPSVVTWEQLLTEQRRRLGADFDADLSAFTYKLHRDNPELDLRSFAVELIREALRLGGVTEPIAVLFFASTFYARIEPTPDRPAEQRLQSAVHAATRAVQPLTDAPIVEKLFYPYISDMSFLGLSDTPESIEAMGRNTPGYGVKTRYPLEEVLGINLPVANLSTHGLDGHKFTERVHMQYTFEVLPNLIYESVINLIGHS